MKKILYLIVFLVILSCCSKSVRKDLKNVENISKIKYDTVYIDEFIQTYILTDSFSSEDAAHFDSMNATGAGLYIRQAERYLDTVVNHYHLIFIPKL